MRSAQAEDSLTLASSIRRWLRIRDGETLLQYGAGNGSLVGAFRRIGIQAWGCDDNLELGGLDEYAKPWLSKEIPDHSYAHVLALDFPIHGGASVLKNLSSRFWNSFLISFFDVESHLLKSRMDEVAKIDPSMVVSACYNPPFATGQGELYLICRKYQ